MEHSLEQMVDDEYSTREITKFVLVLVAILLVSVGLTLDRGPKDIAGWARWFMGIFFLVFGSFKLAGFPMFTEMFAGYDIVAKRIKAYARAYPFIEIGLAVMYLLNLAPTARDLITLVVMAVGSIGVAEEVRRRSGIHCACLGNIIKLPLSTVSLVEDVGMGAMALLMLFFAR